MTIYFVDEDYAKLYALIVELEFRGYTVVPIGDADRAYDALATAPDVELAIIDVMLAAGEGASNYWEGRTDGGRVTGLVLLEDLKRARPDIFPRRAALLTAASTHQLINQVRQSSQLNHVPIWQKGEMSSPKEFGDHVALWLKALAPDTALRNGADNAD